MDKEKTENVPLYEKNINNKIKNNLGWIPIFIIGTVLSLFTILTISWWCIKLYDVKDKNENNITKLRSVMGQIFLILTTFLSTIFCQLIVNNIIWCAWFNTNKTIKSNVILSISSCTNPLLWIHNLRKLDNFISYIYILIIFLIVIFSFILHIIVGLLQNKIIINHDSIKYNESAGWLPEILDKPLTNFSDIYTSNNFLNVIDSIIMGTITDDDIIGSIASDRINFKTITQQKFVNTTLHFYISVPKLEAKIGIISKNTNSTYEWINSTHIKIVLKTDKNDVCNIISKPFMGRYMGDIQSYWIGCDTSYGTSYLAQPHNIFSTDKFINRTNGILDLKGGDIINPVPTGISYKIIDQCYHVYTTMNGTDKINIDKECDNLPSYSKLKYNKIEYLLGVMNTIQYINETLNIKNPLQDLSFLKSNMSYEKSKRYNNAITAALTMCMWADSYSNFLDHERLILPYTLKYYTIGDINIKYFIIVLIPIISTLIISILMKNVNLKIAKLLLKPYWLIAIIVKSNNPHELITEKTENKPTDIKWKAEFSDEYIGLKTE